MPQTIAASRVITEARAPASRGDQGGGQVAATDILLEGTLDLLGKVAGNRHRRHEELPWGENHWKIRETAPILQ